MSALPSPECQGLQLWGRRGICESLPEEAPVPFPWPRESATGDCGSAVQPASRGMWVRVEEGPAPPPCLPNLPALGFLAEALEAEFEALPSLKSVLWLNEWVDATGGDLKTRVSRSVSQVEWRRHELTGHKGSCPWLRFIWQKICSSFSCMTLSEAVEASQFLHL